MCEIQKLRLSVEQILTAAAEEIFGVFKRSITEIEEKLSDSLKHSKINQRLPDTVHQTDILIPPEEQARSPHVDQEDPEPPHIKEEQEDAWISQEGENTVKLQQISEYPTLNQKLWVVKEEQQERSPSLHQVDPVPPHPKEEENLWTNEEGEQLQGREEADIKFPSTPHCVKSQYDEDEAQSSQLHQSQIEANTEEPEDGDYYGESEPDTIQNNDFPISDATSKTTDQCTDAEKSHTFLSLSETPMAVQPAKRFSCSICNKGFAYKCFLKEHMIVHTGEKPFSCTVCNKGFSYKGNLKEHMIVHTGEKPFSCAVCNKGFAHKGNLKEHMLVHTGEKPFRCPVCNKGFAHKSNVKKHMPVHTRERSFCCSVCQKGFLRKNNLEEHMSLHLRETPFSCSVCQKGFRLKWKFKKHMLSHTGKKASVN